MPQSSSLPQNSLREIVNKFFVSKIEFDMCKVLVWEFSYFCNADVLCNNKTKLSLSKAGGL